MNILVISNLYPPNTLGGYELGCAEVVQGLLDRGHRVTVLTSQGRFNFLSPSSGFVKPALRMWNIYEHASLGNALRETTFFHAKVIDQANLAVILQEIVNSSYDVIYCFNLLGLGAIAICDALTSLGSPWVWHLMDSVPSQMIAHIKPEILALFRTASVRRIEPSRAFVMSTVLRREIEQDISLGNNTLILPGWAKIVDSHHVAPPSDDRIRFASVGVLSAEKGTDIILQAASGLPPDTLSRISIEFFGRGDLAHQKREVAKRGLERSVIFHGQLPHDQVLRALPGFTALLFPTWTREPFGFVALEAAASGLIPIITKGIGAAEVLQDGIHAIHINRNVESLKEAIIAVVENKNGIRSMAIESRRHVRSHYTLNHMLNVIENELSAVAAGKRVDPALADRVHRSAIYKERLAQEFVAFASGAPYMAGMESLTVTEAYHSLKNSGRRASKNVLSKWIRSGLMKAMKPYLVEILAQQEQHRIDIRGIKHDISDLAANMPKSDRRKEPG